MFVSDNSLNAVKQYFNERLNAIFSERELKLMFQLSAEKRLNLSPSDLFLVTDIRLSESDLLFFRAIVKRLLAGEPFQYIHGDTEFYGLLLKTDARALIPRPETEELVDWILQDKSPNWESVVDVCTGSGCIALALKSKLPNTKVVAIDISDDALSLSKDNAQFTNLTVEFRKADALSDALLAEENSVDVIVSNPPYVMDKEKEQMKAHVLDFEPHLALFVANQTPFVFYDAIAKQAQRLLKVGGWLYFEINEQFGQEMIDLLKKYGFKSVELKEDLQGKSRMIRGQK